MQTLSTEDQENLALAIHRERVEQARRRLSEPTYITTVAMLDGKIAGCAVWVMHLGSKKPHSLGRYIRTLSWRERLLRLHIASTSLIRKYLPKSLEQWVWKVSKAEQMIKEKERGIMESRREVCKRHWPGPTAEEDHLMLNVLTILPEYERKGIGRALMQQGLDMANKTGTAIYLAASPAGRGFYERVGFQGLEEFEVGDPEIITWTETIMVYRP